MQPDFFSACASEQTFLAVKCLDVVCLCCRCCWCDFWTCRIIQQVNNETKHTSHHSTLFCFSFAVVFPYFAEVRNSGEKFRTGKSQIYTRQTTAVCAEVLKGLFGSRSRLTRIHADLFGVKDIKFTFYRFKSRVNNCSLHGGNGRCCILKQGERALNT